MTLQSMEDYFRDRVRIQTRTPDGMRAGVIFTAELQGPPEAGHGGGVTAMLLELVGLFRSKDGDAARVSFPVRIDVTLHREVPLEKPLVGEVRPAPGGWQARLLQEERLLAEAQVSALGEPVSPLTPELRQQWEASNREAAEVPGYEFCLACGLRNARGAQVRFDYNDAFVWKRLQPPAHFRCADGSLFPAYLCIVADEIGWWLGALRQGECGLSNRVTLSLGRPVPFDLPLLILGERSAVTAVDTRGRIWHARATVVTSEWTSVAAAGVQFAGSRAFTKVMLPRFLPGEDPTGLSRVFPRYAASPHGPDSPAA